MLLALRDLAQSGTEKLRTGLDPGDGAHLAFCRMAVMTLVASSLTRSMTAWLSSLSMTAPSPLPAITALPCLPRPCPQLARSSEHRLQNVRFDADLALWYSDDVPL